MQPSLHVESIPLDRVLPYAENARTHPDEQVAQIAASIAEFGFNVPVLLRLPHAGTDAEAGAPALWWNGSAWEALITTPLNDGRVETSVDHFSVYGVSRVRGFTLPGG